jgi:hypothetical protein
VTGIEKEELCREIDAAVPRDVTHIGIVLSDIGGNIVIRRPEKPKAGGSRPLTTLRES